MKFKYIMCSPLITQCEDKGTGHRRDFDVMDSLKIYHEKILTFNFIRHFILCLKLTPSLKFIPGKRWGEVQKWYGMSIVFII